MPKEIVALAIAISLAMGFLWSFATGGSPYVANRYAYYQTQVEISPASEVESWQVLSARDPIGTNCLGSAKPRPTNVAWMGASEQEMITWYAANEKKCLADFLAADRAARSDVLPMVATQALDSINEASHFPSD